MQGERKLHTEMTWRERMSAPLWTMTEEINLQAERLRNSLPWINPARMAWYYLICAYDSILNVVAGPV